MSASVKLDVEGLKEFRAALKAVDAAFPKQLQQVNKRAAELIVPEAKRRAGQVRPNLASGLARVGSRGVNSIRAGASQRSAYIMGGGARVPWFGGNEWGSSGRYRQFPGRTTEGYILWQAAKTKEPEVFETYSEMIAALSAAAFPS